MMALEATAWDPAEHLRSPEDEQAYIEAAFEDGDPNLIAAAIGDLARARGMAQIARDAGISREVMYKSFRAGGRESNAGHDYTCHEGAWTAVVRAGAAGSRRGIDMSA